MLMFNLCIFRDSCFQYIVHVESRTISFFLTSFLLCSRQQMFLHFRQHLDNKRVFEVCHCVGFFSNLILAFLSASTLYSVYWVRLCPQIESHLHCQSKSLEPNHAVFINAWKCWQWLVVASFKQHKFYVELHFVLHYIWYKKCATYKNCKKHNCQNTYRIFWTTERTLILIYRNLRTLHV